MIVAELNIVRIAILETKADTPLIVYGDRMLTKPITFERMQPISWRHQQVRESECRVDRFQFPHRTPRHFGRDAFRLPGAEELFGRAVGERLDHTEMYRVT